MAIKGRFVQLMFNGSTLEYQEGERSSVLTISKSHVSGAGSSHNTNKNKAQLKSWSITSELLFKPSAFTKVFRYIESEELAQIKFGNSAWHYDGTAFPKSLRITGNVNSLVKCSIEWQGTGPLKFVTTLPIVSLQ